MDVTKFNLIDQLENDEFYKCFLIKDSKNVSNYSLTLAEQVKKLGDGIELLSQELQKQVLEKHDDLLQQANHATKLENVLNIMNNHVQNLFANAERLKAQSSIPFDELDKHTKVLGRLHLASHILRQVNRLQQLSKRLNTTNDPVQKATILQELSHLAADPDLVDVDAVTAELRNIRTHQQKVVQLSTSSLNQGILNQNVTQTTTALQIFINLGTINSTTESFIEQQLMECRQSLQAAFDIQSSTLNNVKGGPGRVALTSSQGFRTKVENELEKVFLDDFYLICKHITFLQEILNSIQLENFDANKASVFWISLGKIIQEEIKKSSSAIKQLLEEDYPKLLKYYYELVKKISYEPFALDRLILKPLENSYLSTSLTRMLDPIQAMFVSESNIPTHDQIDLLIRVISSEISVALIEETLSQKISKNVGKCIKMYAVKTEQQIETGPEASQVIGATTNNCQQKNISLANTLYYLQTQVHRMLSNMKESLPSACVNIICESLQSLDTLVGVIMQPLVVSINSVIETIIITIHLETDWGKLQNPTNKSYQSCSPYMRELTQFISRAFQTYLVHFDNKEVLTVKCCEIAIRCIDLFVRHSSLLRPISAGGRLRLQSDYLHLENALTVICPHLPDLGRPFRLFKSVASLIVQSPSQIVDSQINGSSVPHSTILLLLFAFAGPELASPNQNTNWSLPKLSAWLDEHTDERERLDLVAGALQKYESIVRQTNSVNYDPVYPIMSQFLKNAYNHINT